MFPSRGHQCRWKSSSAGSDMNSHHTPETLYRHLQLDCILRRFLTCLSAPLQAAAPSISGLIKAVHRERAMLPRIL